MVSVLGPALDTVPSESPKVLFNTDQVTLVLAVRFTLWPSCTLGELGVTVMTLPAFRPALRASTPLHAMPRTSFDTPTILSEFASLANETILGIVPIPAFTNGLEKSDCAICVAISVKHV